MWNRWIPYARWLWQQNNGPIPAGHCVDHIDGDSLNDQISNLQLVDRAGHARLQQHRDPGIIKRMRKSAARAAKRRHAHNRKMKERVRRQAELNARRLEQARRSAERQLQKDRHDRERVETGISELRGPMATWWECIGCGCEFATEPTGICPKCNGFRFEKITQRCVA